MGRLKNPGAVGRQKERKAAIFLSNKGYHILEHSYRSPCGEIDLIAEQGGRIIFVEVKYRRSLQCGLPSEAVNRGKQRRRLMGGTRLAILSMRFIRLYSVKEKALWI